MNNSIREKLCQIVDSFLAEAKDQHGNERSLGRLNADRQLAVDNLVSLFDQEKRAYVRSVLPEKMKITGRDEEDERRAIFNEAIDQALRKMETK